MLTKPGGSTDSRLERTRFAPGGSAYGFFLSGMPCGSTDAFFRNRVCIILLVYEGLFDRASETIQLGFAS